ncbi:MAG: HAMP domain-containing protein, partial [candidate division NC10 bacterium]|nr:HAMP domain-containing protein [candidate division NC10 bacterium]
EPMWHRSRWKLSLRGKLLGMMFGLLMLVLATLFLLYWRAESQLISQVERHTTDLSTAIQISVEQLTSKGRTSEARLQDYVQRLQQRGVREISIVSNEEEVVASSNPRRVGARVDQKRKDLLITARLGEENVSGRSQKTYNLFVPIVVGNQRSGYILISMILDDFAELAQVNFIKRLIATVLVFGIGIAGTVVLAWTYAKPISRVMEAARRVAQGNLDEHLPTNRRDEIGELNRSFNEMVQGLREKAELEARLHQAERLSAIGHLASGIAHEVRNPLNSISLIIDHLGAQFPPSGPAEREEFARLTSIIKQEIHRLNSMIETFLKYGKPLELKRQPTDIRTLLDEVLEVAAQKAQAQQIRVERDYATGLPEVWVDAPYIKTCFLNLVLNALQAMTPGGGSLAVTARPAPDGAGGQSGDLATGQSGTPPDRQSAQLPGCQPADGWVEVRFQDTGVGIAPEHLPRVFEPYFTTKEVGIGLGLALTKQILEQHGARIELSSQPGKGTVARVEFPAGAPKA